jgi:hypothetical protein
MVEPRFALASDGAHILSVRAIKAAGSVARARCESDLASELHFQALALGRKVGDAEAPGCWLGRLRIDLAIAGACWSALRP